MMIIYTCVETPAGCIGIGADEFAIRYIRFDGELFPPGERGETPLLEEAVDQIRRYFAKELREFTVPVAPAGTDFQQKVWSALRLIPYGATASYSDIAVAAGNPLAVRAVGMANHNNPIPIIIPCHRVIGKNGSLTGYAGGLDIKRQLLALEAEAAGFSLSHR